MMRDCSPLLLELGEDDPGIIVTNTGLIGTIVSRASA